MGKAKSGPCQTALIAAAPDADDLARSRKRTKWLANGVLVATVAVASRGRGARRVAAAVPPRGKLPRNLS